MVTIRDIAEKAGVSIGTVDRIIHNRGRYSSETARRVHQIIRDVGYKPNLMARRLSDSRSCRIGVLLPYPEQDSGYWLLPLSGINRAAREFESFGLTLSIHHYDRYLKTGSSGGGSFTTVASELIGENPDGILMAPLMESTALEFKQQLKPRFPIIFIDTDLPGVDRLGYIGQDSYQSGHLAARLIHTLINGKAPRQEKTAGRVLIVTPDTKNEHLENRIRGFSDHSSGGVELLKATVESDQNLDIFHKQLGSILNNHKIEGIFVSDASAHFVADFLQNSASEAGGATTLPLVGYDLVPENRKWLKRGIIDFLLTQRPGEQGYNGISRLFRKIFLEEDGPENEFTSIDIITRENMVYVEDK